MSHGPLWFLGVPLALLAVIAIEVALLWVTVRPPRTWHVVAVANLASALVAFLLMVWLHPGASAALAYPAAYLVEFALMIGAWWELGWRRVTAAVLLANLASVALVFVVLLPVWDAITARVVPRPAVHVQVAESESWEPVQFSHTGDAGAGSLSNLVFTDAQRGWAIQRGQLVRTTDGGRHWRGTGHECGRISFVTPEIGWATRPDPGTRHSYSVGRSSDAGQTWAWAPLPSGRLYGFGILAGVSKEEAWLIRDRLISGDLGSDLLHTADGGASWQKTALPLRVYVYGMSFLDREHGWLIGKCEEAPRHGFSRLVVLRTSDAGGTFTVLHPPQVDTLNGPDWRVSAVTADEVWAAVGARSLLHTEDGGDTWEVVSPSFGSRSSDIRLWDCAFPSASSGWAVGWLLEDRYHSRALALHTQDGGETWVRERTGAEAVDDSDLQRVVFADESHGWLLGTGGMYPSWAPADPVQYLLAYAGGSPRPGR